MSPSGEMCIRDSLLPADPAEHGEDVLMLVMPVMLNN